MAWSTPTTPKRSGRGCRLSWKDGIHANRSRRRAWSTGTDVDFGALTRLLLDSLRAMDGFDDPLQQPRAGSRTGRRSAGACASGMRPPDGTARCEPGFVFIGAGGGSLPLLQKADIPEARGYAGFPVSGLWLRCDRPEIASRHDAKVYGKAGDGHPADVRAPPGQSPRRRKGLAALRPVRGLFDQVPQARIVSRPLRHDRPRQHPADARGWQGQPGPGAVPARRASGVVGGALRGATAVLSERSPAGLEAGAGRASACRSSRRTRRAAASCNSARS